MKIERVCQLRGDGRGPPPTPPMGVGLRGEEGCSDKGEGYSRNEANKPNNTPKAKTADTGFYEPKIGITLAPKPSLAASLHSPVDLSAAFLSTHAHASGGLLSADGLKARSAGCRQSVKGSSA